MDELNLDAKYDKRRGRPQNNPNSLKNLKRGGSPGKIPGKFSLVANLKAYLQKNPDAVKEIVEKVSQRARDGSINHTSFIFDRIDGPVTNKTEISGPDAGPIQITFNVLGDK
jgi:hypothetical protein